MRMHTHTNGVRTCAHTHSDSKTQQQNITTYNTPHNSETVNKYIRTCESHVHTKHTPSILFGFCEGLRGEGESAVSDELAKDLTGVEGE